MSPPPLHAEHRCRVSALEPERVWSLRGDVLWMGDGPGREFAIPLASLRRIRLVYSPTRLQMNRFRCYLENEGGSCGVIQNEHYAGIADFEDRSGSYRELVALLAKRTAAVNPACRFVSGCSMAAWLGQTVMMGAMAIVLAVVMVFLWQGIGWMVVLKLLVLAWFVPTAVRWVARNKPRVFEPGALPAELLPEAGTKEGEG